MKKERDCNNNYPVYPMMQMPMMGPMQMPNMGMMQNMVLPNNTMNTIPNNTLNNYDTEIARLEQRINLLERRIITLETGGNTSNNYSNYNSSGYQML